MEKLIKLGKIAQALKILQSTDSDTLKEMMRIDGTISDVITEVGEKLASVNEKPQQATATEPTQATAQPAPQPAPQQVAAPTAQAKSINISGVRYEPIPEHYKHPEAYVGSDGYIYTNTGNGFTKNKHGATPANELTALIGKRQFKVKPIVAEVFFNIKPGRHILVANIDGNTLNCAVENLAPGVVKLQTTRTRKDFGTVSAVAEIIAKHLGSTKECMKEIKERHIDVSLTTFYKIKNGEYRQDITSKYFTVSSTGAIVPVKKSEPTPTPAPDEDQKEETRVFIANHDNDAPVFLQNNPYASNKDIIDDILERYRTNSYITDRDFMVLICDAVKHNKTWSSQETRSYIMKTYHIPMITECKDYKKLINLTKTAGLFAQNLRWRFCIEDIK